MSQRASEARSKSARWWNGWALVAWTVLGLLAMVSAILSASGLGEDGVRGVIRATARVAVLLFLLPFTTSALRRAWRSPASAWLLKNRRYLGLSFAVAHFLHLGAVAALAARALRPFFTEQGDILTLGGGGLAYLFLAAMTVTSFPHTAAWLGRRWWDRIHTTGGYLLWVVFFQSYFFRSLVHPVYLPLTLALLSALALRLWALLARRKEAIA